MNTDKSFNNQPKPQGKPLDAGTPDKDTESRLDELTDKPSSGMQETRPGPGGEAPGQVAKM